MNKLLKTSLPKWPQCVIVGNKLEPEQALEIIRRTDTFFSHGGGNNKQWNEQVEHILQIPQDPKRPLEENQESWEAYVKALEEHSGAKANWCDSWGLVETEYIYNSWISSAYIGGPCGWCHPDGTILFGENIGKWPSVQDVVEDWEILLKAFPFLVVTCVLMDREHCESDPKPLVALKIRDKKIKLVGPEKVENPEFWEGTGFQDLTEVQKEIQTNQRGIEDFTLDVSREIGLPLEVIERWAKVTH